MGLISRVSSRTYRAELKEIDVKYEFIVCFCKNLAALDLSLGCLVYCFAYFVETSSFSTLFTIKNPRKSSAMPSLSPTEVSIKGQGLQLRDAEDIEPLIKQLQEKPSVEILTL